MYGTGKGFIRRLAAAFLILAAVILLIVLYIYAESRYGISIPCPIYCFTGLYCPGCGSGRAFHEFYRGHIAAAFRQNPMFVILAPAAVLYFTARLIDYVISGRNRIDKYIPDKLLIGIFVILIIFGVIRNIPTDVFYCLRPV